MLFIGTERSKIVQQDALFNKFFFGTRIQILCSSYTKMLEHERDCEHIEPQDTPKKYFDESTEVYEQGEILASTESRRSMQYTVNTLFGSKGM